MFYGVGKMKGINSNVTAFPRSQGNSFTLDIEEAAHFLGAHKETIRRLAASGELPAVKIGRRWKFIEEDLVMYMRSKYARNIISQGADVRSKTRWRFTNETTGGGFRSHTTDKEFNEALGLQAR